MIPKPYAYLLRFGELSLKGRNRDRFINTLIQIVKPRVAHLNARVEKRHKKLLVYTQADPSEVREAFKTVFGITGISPIWNTSHEMDDIKELAWNLIESHAGSGKTFAVRAKRPNKRYPILSMDIQRDVAGSLLERGLDLPVDLKNSDLTLNISIEMKESWLHMETWPGMGGLPVNKAVIHGLLLSGGIDSPVAGNLIQKRGGHMCPIYFHTPPFTVDAALEKVVDLATILARYQNGMTLHVVNFTEVMKTLRAECRERFIVVLSRRFMMRVACKIMDRVGGKSLITGESLSQVASQTIENIAAINEGVPYPILRPLIGMDKLEIVNTSKKLDMFETSIRPFEDCCSLFAPKDPATKARLWDLHDDEARLDIDGLVERALEATEEIVIST